MRGAAAVLAALVACGEVTPPRKPGVAPTAARSPAPSLELVPGVIIDRDGRTLFASSSGGQLTAIDVATGAEQWTSFEAARPLLLTPRGVLAQRDSEGAVERLDLAMIDTRSGKLSHGCEPVRIAAWARATLEPAADQDFAVRARPSIEGRPVVEWRARARQPIAGVDTHNDAGVAVLPQAAGFGLIDPGTCGVLDIGPLGADAAPWEAPGLGPLTVDGVTAELVIAPGVTGQVAALRRRKGGETQPDVSLAADLDINAAPLWSADRRWASVTSPEPGRGGDWSRWIVAGVADGVPLASFLVHARPRGFAVTDTAIIVVLTDELEAFDRAGNTLWKRGIRAPTYEDLDGSSAAPP